MTIPIIGVDLGFGHVKVAGPGFRSTYPAVVAEPTAWSEPTGLVEWGHHKFLVGAPALNEGHHRYSTRIDKASTPEEMAKYLVGLALACRHYDTRVLTVATGLPPAHYKDQILRQELQHRMTGAFTFRFEGQPYCIQVNHCSVDPQAGAALFDALLHEDGELANPELLSQRTLILDAGHRTTDVALMVGRRAAIGGRSIFSIEQGVWTVYQEVTRLLMRDHRLSLTPAEVDAFWRSGQALRLAGSPLLLEPYVRRAVLPVGRAITADVMRQVGDIRL